MFKLNFKEKLAQLKNLNQQVKWSWKFGISKSSPENYSLVFTSQPIDSKIFIDMVKFITKEQYHFPIDDMKLWEEVVLPQNVWIEHEDKLLTIFPKVNPKNEKLTSCRLNKFSLTKTISGLVIRGELRGLRVC